MIFLLFPAFELQGTGYVYDAVLQPFMARHEREIDMKLVEWEARAWDCASFYWEYCSEFAHVAFARAMQYLAAQSRNLKLAPIGTKVRAFPLCSGQTVFPFPVTVDVRLRCRDSVVLPVASKCGQSML